MDHGPQLYAYVPSFTCLRIKLGPDGRSLFSFVQGSNEYDFLVELSQLVRLSLGDTVLITAPHGTVAMFLSGRIVHVQVQMRYDLPVEFEMRLDKFAMLLIRLMNARREFETTGDRGPECHLGGKGEGSDRAHIRQERELDFHRKDK